MHAKPGADTKSGGGGAAACRTMMRACVIVHGEWCEGGGGGGGGRPPPPEPMLDPGLSLTKWNKQQPKGEYEGEANRMYCQFMVHATSAFFFW